MGALALIAVIGAGASYASSREEAKDTKEAQEEYALQQGLLEQQALNAEKQAEFDAKESVRLRIQERQRNNTWKTKDQFKDDTTLGLTKSVLGRTI